MQGHGNLFKQTGLNTRETYMSSISLNILNYAAAALHGVQAIVVLCLIQYLNHKNPENTPLLNGIYAVQKNVYVLRYPEGAPKCDLPVLRNLTSADNTNTTQAVALFNAIFSLWGGDPRGTPMSYSEIMGLMGNNQNAATDAMISMLLDGTNGLQIASNNFHRFQDSYAIPNNFFVGNVDLRYLIFAFFLLSCLFQALDGWWGTYTANSAGPRLLRFVEYSFSASIMILAIALEMGIVEIYTLCCMFALIFATNILGLIAEGLVFIAENTRELVSTQEYPGLFIHPVYWWTIPHFLSWIICLIGYAPLLDAYLTSTRCSERSPPGFVNVIVFLEFFLFVCFGLVQLYSLYSKTVLLINSGGSSRSNRYSTIPSWEESGSQLSTSQNNDRPSAPWNTHDITYQADYAYIILSFTAKTLLAWLILAPTL